MAQEVSRRLPTAAAKVRDQVRSCGICGGQSGIWAGFLRVLRFPLTILIPPTAPHSSSSVIRGWYNRPVSYRSTKWTQSHPTPRKLKKNITWELISLEAHVKIRTETTEHILRDKDFLLFGGTNRSKRVLLR
jgi:hypothetical protein